MNATQYLDDLRERLQKRQSTKVAREAGLHANVVRRIRNGVVTNPSLETATAIHAALDSIERQQSRQHGAQILRHYETLEILNNIDHNGDEAHIAVADYAVSGSTEALDALVDEIMKRWSE